MRRSLTFFLLALLAATPACRPDDDGEEPVEPHEPDVVQLDAAEAARIARATEAAVAVHLADGLEMRLWAPEQLVKDPVAIDIDDRGVLYYTRTNRKKHSEFDIRGHRDWMIEVIGFETVEDRRAFLRRVFAPERSDENTYLPDLNADSLHDWHDLAVEEERVYRLQDADGDGLAEEARLVVEDFHTEVTDVAGGLLVTDDAIYLGIAPDLWRLRDTDGDGLVDVKKSLVHGFQVHVGFGAHGMSGVTMGPDGRLYWSIGDIGSNVVDDEGRRWATPHQGAIFRSEVDGTGFEVFAAGLRNVHEFVFDDFGNLISVDNDGDHPGEHERLVYITDGSDSGWRIHWQFGKYLDPDNNAYKVWMDEGYFRPRFPGQAAHLTPPVAPYNTGPAGMVYNPGTALGPEWRDHFFLAEFAGSPNSRISAFRLEEDGATFRLAEEKEVMRGLNATGMAFGPDGALYFADWVEGWDAKDRGRIWTLDVPGGAAAPERVETRQLLAAPFAGRTEADLQALLRHADQRVRLKAQFELARRGATDALLTAARQTDNRLARLHGLWGLGQLSRRDAAVAEPIAAFLRDADAEVRAQAAELLGDVAYAPAADALVALLGDAAPRVRFFAAQALGRIGHRPAVQPILDMLEANDDVDAYLRHAGTLALARIGEAEPLVALAGHPSRALRLAAVVALRRLRHPGVARFLEDPDEYVATDAARAINDDESIEEALPALAAMLGQERFVNEPLLRRAVNANLRLGTAAHAEAVAAFAARPAAPEALRVEALAALGVWARPSVLDRVDGRRRGEVVRDTAIARAAVAPLLAAFLSDASTAVRAEAARTAGRLRDASAAPVLLARLRTDAAPEVRVAALEALAALGGTPVEEAVRTGLADADVQVRMAALRRVPSLPVAEDVVADLLAEVVLRGTTAEQQAALAALGDLRGERARAVLGGLLDGLVAGRVPAPIQLDVMEAVDAHDDAELRQRLDQYRAARPADDLTAAYAETLAGGDPERGARVYFNNPGAMCTRCHMIGDYGSNVGPDLTLVGTRATPAYLLESLLAPSAHLVPGYGALSLTLHDGQQVSGMLREETPDSLLLELSTGEPRRVAKADVASQNAAVSSMPPMGNVLTRRELRDLISFLYSLR